MHTDPNSNNIHKPKPSFFPWGSTKKKITCTRKLFELEIVTNHNFNIKILYGKKKNTANVNSPEPYYINSLYLTYIQETETT